MNDIEKKAFDIMMADMRRFFPNFSDEGFIKQMMSKKTQEELKNIKPLNK